MRMTWPYIAGFLDGDGCISERRLRTRKGYCRIFFTQAGKGGKALLDEMRQFLLGHGVNCFIHTVAARGNWKERHNLIVGSRVGVTYILPRVLTWLTVKDVKARDLLEYENVEARVSASSVEDMWAYIAGYFDAEGSLHAMGRDGDKFGGIDIAQSGDRGRRSLTKVQTFLAENGVRATVVNTEPQHPNCQEGFRLRMYSVGDRTTFMRRVFPYLRIKKVAVQDTLRFLSLFPNRVRGREVDIAKIQELWDDGLCVKDIATSLGYHRTSITNILNETVGTRPKRLVSRALSH